MTLFLGRNADDVGGKVQQVGDELVGMLSLDSELGQRFGGIVGKIAGHDDIDPRTNRGSEDVTIIRVGKLKGRDQVFVVRDQTIPDVRSSDLGGEVMDSPMMGAERW